MASAKRFVFASLLFSAHVWAIPQAIRQEQVSNFNVRSEDLLDRRDAANALAPQTTAVAVLEARDAIVMPPLLLPKSKKPDSSKAAAPKSSDPPKKDDKPSPAPPKSDAPKSDPPKDKGTPTNKAKGTLTMTANLGTATPFKRAGDMSAKTFHDEVYGQLDKGCKPTCPNAIEIHNVQVLQGENTQKGTIKVLIDEFRFRDDKIRTALLHLVAGASQSAINSESSKEVTYTQHRIIKRDVNGTSWDEQLDEEAFNLALAKRDADPDRPVPYTVKKKIIQGTLPNSITAQIYDKNTDEKVGSAVLLPDWEADKKDIFSQMMCNLAMAFIKSTVIDIVTTSLDVASAISGKDLDPCSVGFG